MPAQLGVLVLEAPDRAAQRLGHAHPRALAVRGRAPVAPAEADGPGQLAGQRIQLALGARRPLEVVPAPRLLDLGLQLGDPVTVGALGGLVEHRPGVGHRRREAVLAGRLVRAWRIAHQQVEHVELAVGMAKESAPGSRAPWRRACGPPCRRRRPSSTRPRAGTASRARRPQARGRRGRGGGRQQLPRVTDGGQRVTAAIGEADPRARHQVRHGPRHQHLARRGAREDLSAHVHGDAPEFPVVQLAFAGVKARPARDTRPLALGDDRLRAADGPRRPVEGCGEAGPARGQHVTAEARRGAVRPRRGPRSAARPGSAAVRGASTNITVATTRSGSGSGRVPVTSSWISAITGSVSPIHGR